MYRPRTFVDTATQVRTVFQDQRSDPQGVPGNLFQFYFGFLALYYPHKLQPHQMLQEGHKVFFVRIQRSQWAAQFGELRDTDGIAGFCLLFKAQLPE